MVIDTEAGKLRAGGEVCGALERAAGCVEFRVGYRHVLWEGEEVGTDDRVGCVEVDEGGAHLTSGL